jgi:hypothetical protein
MGAPVTRIDLGGYARRLECFDFRLRRRDLPRDCAGLLALALDIDLEDTIAVDREGLSTGPDLV